jgi:hypothetical protein
MSLKLHAVDYSLAFILVRAFDEVEKFQKISFLHVLRENKQQEDVYANEASSFKHGVLRIYEVKRH